MYNILIRNLWDRSAVSRDKNLFLVMGEEGFLLLCLQTILMGSVIMISSIIKQRATYTPPSELDRAKKNPSYPLSTVVIKLLCIRICLLYKCDQARNSIPLNDTEKTQSLCLASSFFRLSLYTGNTQPASLQMLGHSDTLNWSLTLITKQIFS